jgi:hypothetical protein
MKARVLAAILRVTFHWTLFVSATWILATIGPTRMA